GLPQTGPSFHHVYEIVDDAILQPHDDVQVAETDVRIDETNPQTLERDPRSQVGGRGRLADAALPAGNDHHPTRHGLNLLLGPPARTLRPGSSPRRCGPPRDLTVRARRRETERS